jgi:mycothiol system anti-sigma-R factor
MDCTQARTYMHGYLDRELDPVLASRIDAHLHACAECTEAYAVQTSLQTAIKSAAEYYTAPAALAARIRAKVGAASAPATPTMKVQRWQWFPLAAAVAATAVITWTTAIQLGTGSRDERLGEQVIAGHARAMLTNHLTEVASSDQHTVKPWLSSKLDFSPPVTDLATAGFPLVGGRLDYVDHRPVATLVYRHRLHVIDLFVWPDANAGATGIIEAASKQGFNMLHWNSAGMTFWAISDLNQADIKTFAQTYANAK